jgi:parvulin-like peptidyl-prolyl isomerase
MAKKDDVKAPVEEEEAEEHEDEEAEDESDEEETDDEGADDAEDEDDDEDEDEDEDDDAAEAHGVGDHTAPAAEPEDPSWWLPHAVLGVLVTLGVLGFFGVFNKFLRPLFHKEDAAAEAASASAPPATPAHAPSGAPPTVAPPKAPDAPLYGAKHLVVQYKGSARAPASVTRTKDEAKARAEEALKKIKGGAKFEDVVGDYSDEPGAKERGGDLGRFRPGTFDPKFVEAVQGMKVGDVSGVVETQFGFHVILRTQ